MDAKQTPTGTLTAEMIKNQCFDSSAPLYPYLLQGHKDVEVEKERAFCEEDFFGEGSAMSLIHIFHKGLGQGLPVLLPPNEYEGALPGLNGRPSVYPGGLGYRVDWGLIPILGNLKDKRG